MLYDDKIFLTSNSRDGELIELRGTSTRSKWKNRNMRIHFNAGVVVGDYLYGADGRIERGKTVRCINMKTGETEWTKSSMPCSSITAADDKLIILTRDGNLYIAEASPSRFKQLAKSRVITGTCWTARCWPTAAFTSATPAAHFTSSDERDGRRAAAVGRETRRERPQVFLAGKGTSSSSLPTRLAKRQTGTKSAAARPRRTTG